MYSKLHMPKINSIFYSGVNLFYRGLRKASIWIVLTWWLGKTHSSEPISKRIKRIRFIGCEYSEIFCLNIWNFKKNVLNYLRQYMTNNIKRHRKKMCIGVPGTLYLSFWILTRRLFSSMKNVYCRRFPHCITWCEIPEATDLAIRIMMSNYKKWIILGKD